MPGGAAGRRGWSALLLGPSPELSGGPSAKFEVPLLPSFFVFRTRIIYDETTSWFLKDLFCVRTPRDPSVCTHAGTYIHVCMCVYMHECIYACVCEHTCVCTYVCV